MPKVKGCFVAATGQHVGKTTTCLGLISGLLKKRKQLAFMKPVGQKHVEIEKGVFVDKDVLLFRDYFGFKEELSCMSPVLFPQRFTRDYLDGKVREKTLKKSIKTAYETLGVQDKTIIVEGTGHVGVGSIVNLSNASIASLLNIPLIMITSGGLGSSFDSFSINKALCDANNVPIAGVILNRVLSEKREMVLHYMEKALSRWKIPLLGCIPFDPFLSKPSMKDFETLFETTLLSGEKRLLRYFRHTRLVATSLETFRTLMSPSQLVITPANREEIILAILTKHWDVKMANPNDDLEAGLILTGEKAPRPSIIEALRKAHIPMLYVPLSNYKVMEMITSFTVKIREEDKEKIREAVTLVEDHIDFDIFAEATGL